MTKDAPPSLTPEAKRRQERQRARQAAALRENLGKRKAQDRARAPAPESPDPVTE